MMNAAVFSPLRNKVGRNDATGAFQPEATKFCQLHNVGTKVHLVDNHGDPLDMREHVYRVLDDALPGSLAAVVFFCHGWRAGIQFGLGIEHLTNFALRIKRAVAPGARVVLYACDAGRDLDSDDEDDKNDFVGGDGGFADKLRDALADAGCPVTVYAHSTEGHTTWNPNLRVFLPTERFGGRFVVAKNSGLWKKWASQMRHTDLRFRVPFMTPLELTDHLENA